MKKLLTLLLIALSIPAFSTNVTFNVKLSGQDIPKDTVFIVGDFTDWLFVPMYDLGDSLYTYTADIATGPDTLGYYFITVNSWDSAGNEDWNYYKRYREWFDTICAAKGLLRWDTDRSLIVGAQDMTVTCYFAKCPDYVPPTPSVIKVMETDAELFVYPNPSAGDVTLRLPEFDGAIQIELTDVSGKLLNVNKSLAGTNEVHMQTSVLPKGVYFIKAHSKEFSEIRKLIIN